MRLSLPPADSPSPARSAAGTECCPIGWLEHAGSCYWFSRSGSNWPEAQKYCQLENAHLVAINSREEQVTPGMQTLGGWVRRFIIF